MMPDPSEKQKAKREPGQPRKRRKASIYDGEGNEVLITLMCLKCKKMKPLVMFGLRKMADGAIRNQPWCRTCRSGAGTSKDRHSEEAVDAAPAEATLAPVLEVVPAEPIALAAPPAPIQAASEPAPAVEAPMLV